MYFLKKLSFPWGPVSKTRTEQLQKSQRVKAVNTLVNQKAFSPSRGFTMPVPISMMEGAKWPRLQEQSSTITWGHHWKGLFHTDKNMERWGERRTARGRCISTVIVGSRMPGGNSSALHYILLQDMTLSLLVPDPSASHPMREKELGASIVWSVKAS